MLINYGEVSDEQTTFTPLAEGDYTVTVEKCEEDVTKNGNPCFNFVFTVKDEKLKVFDSLIFTEKTVNRAKKVASTLGLDVTQPHDYQPADYIGKSCIAKVIITDYTGKDGTAKQKNEIDWWNSQKTETTQSSSKIPF